jgi:S-adenosylmethionine synthetase
MIRYAETVLNGHPDKFCDLMADRLIKEAYQEDKVAFAQIEASVWSDQIFFTGAIATSSPVEMDVTKLIRELGREIGYTDDNHIDASKYVIHDHICKLTKPNEDLSAYVNDQCIITGYAGYDEKTRLLPPEQFAAWFFRENIIHELSSGLLKRQGPDGKLLIVIDENNDEWKIRSLLLTLQQEISCDYTKFVGCCAEALLKIFTKLIQHDDRWVNDFDNIRLLINPNGSFIEGGSNGDNGQTGRKLVMDYYGPRIPIGGGALYGKCLNHIDRLGAYAARRYALELCQQGADEAFINICYAPGLSKPMDITIRSKKGPHCDPYSYFDSGNLSKQVDTGWMNYDLFKLGTFYNEIIGR